MSLILAKSEIRKIALTHKAVQRLDLLLLSIISLL